MTNALHMLMGTSLHVQLQYCESSGGKGNDSDEGVLSTEWRSENEWGFERFVGKFWLLSQINFL